MGILKTPERQNPLAKWAMTHAVLAAIFSALALATWAAIIVGDWRAVGVSGVVMFLVVFLLWMPGGPARRREERLFPREQFSDREPGPG